jgi:hypothetical protein
MKTDGYIFVTQNQSNIAPNAVAPTLRYEEVTLEIGNVDVLVDDVIHMRYKENGIPKGLYGVVIFEDMDGATPSFVFKFDSNIYELYSNISQGDFLGADIYRGIQYEKVSTYNISTDVTRANYSEELKSYNVSLSHDLTINSEGREFFGSFKNVIVADKIIFADYCKSYAYGVSLSEDSYNNRKNKFRKSINFNIAKR